MRRPTKAETIKNVSKSLDERHINKLPIIQEGRLGLLAMDIVSKAQKVLGPYTPVEMRDELAQIMIALYKKYNYDIK